MPKSWWRPARVLFVAQAVCLLVVFVWSVRHVPTQDGGSGKKEEVPASPVANAGKRRAAVLPVVPFRTDHPMSGTLDLRPLDVEAAPPTVPRNAGQFEFNGATVYVVPLAR